MTKLFVHKVLLAISISLCHLYLFVEVVLIETNPVDVEVHVMPARKCQIKCHEEPRLWCLKLLELKCTFRALFAVICLNN